MLKLLTFILSLAFPQFRTLEKLNRQVQLLEKQDHTAKTFEVSKTSKVFISLVNLKS